jgi:nicotinamidase-related amidase
MPGLLKVGDSVVDTKKRYDCFVGTDLDFRLKALGINTIFMTGINTNSCVLATAIAANVRDYSVVVIEDCVDTMDSRDHHDAALMCLRTAFAVTISAKEAVGALRQWQQAGYQNGDAA